MYIQNYRPSKTWLDHSLKTAVSEHPSTVDMLKGPKHLSKMPETTFIIFFHPLLKFEIMEVFLNTFTVNYKYPVQDCDNLRFPIPMLLS